MSSSTVSVPTPTQHAFQRRVDDVKIPKSDINFVVMDYLITEGYPLAAEKFAKEANLKYPVIEGSIQARVTIRRAILSGDIESARNQINDLNPEILDKDLPLDFALLKLQLIELIRKCTSSPEPDVSPALEFSQMEVAPLAATNPDFLRELEVTMCLLIILPSDGPVQSPYAELLKPSLRLDVASRVNKAILESMGARGESKLRSLVRLRTWAEDKARAAGLDIPPFLPLTSDGAQDGAEETNGNHDCGDMVS
ncbi:uncharacterized protein EI97DRAFT_435951 [Westerdykella ornata]|uniref:CTLH domain-containing protein n=1 Tax=Westerdykella ornata TaxID=318751 RepID=A0A6A6JAB7_WESOR|nr:uncharacterized protein EI97DRAFT_435951 [Westerdykella ornata]KAF2273531.1 hypothetical protein EI97DRAFT_435951 [Westerdykella ornata]